MKSLAFICREIYISLFKRAAFAGSVRLGSAVCFGIVGRPKLLDAQFNRIVNKGLDDLRQFAVAAFGDFGAEHGAQGEVLQFGHGTSAGLQIGDGLPCDS